MIPFKTIEIEANNLIRTIWLNRPDVHNAINGTMINEILSALEMIAEDHAIRILIIRGKGKSFCAGADLQWMKAAINYSFELNYDESRKLAKCFSTIYNFPVPVIAVGHGSVFGGGNGFLAAADLAICSKNTRFAFSEVGLGLVPAVISPYIFKRMGEGKTRELMLWGTHFNGEDAEKWCLVNYSLNEEAIETYLNKQIEQLLKNSPQALRSTKDLILNMAEFQNKGSLIEETIKKISEARISKDGQEGMKAYLEKRKPNWS